MIKLTIAIPTFNREVKLRRCIMQFATEIVRCQLQDSVEILVSDNASPDQTSQVVQSIIAEFPQLTIRYQRHAENLGISGNLLSLYRNAGGEYLWFFSDDDVIFPDSINRILTVLHDVTPSVLLFSFTQPPGSTVRLFDFPEPVHIVRDPTEAVSLLTRDAKISLCVYRKTAIPEDALAVTAEKIRTCSLFGFWGLGFDVLAACEQSPMAIISEPQAGCDDDYVACLNWHPLNWELESSVFDHPYVKKNAPEIYRDRLRWAYRTGFNLLWMWRSGFMAISDRMTPKWWEALRKFPIKWGWVRGGVLMRLIALKIWPSRLPYLMVRAKRGLFGKRT